MNYPAKSAYQNKNIAQDYDRHRFLSIKGVMTDKREKALIYKAITNANIKPPSKLLDVPCGTGRLTLFLAEKKYQVTGVDISQIMIDQGKSKFQQNKLSADFVLGDTEALPFSDAYFEMAISLRLFGHLPTENRIKVLKELNRVSSSFIAVAYYHKNSLQTLLKKKKRAKKGVFWNPVSLKQMDKELEAANFKSIAKFFLCPYICETVVVLAKKI